MRKHHNLNNDYLQKEIWFLSKCKNLHLSHFYNIQPHLSMYLRSLPALMCKPAHVYLYILPNYKLRFRNILKVGTKSKSEKILDKQLLFQK